MAEGLGAAHQGVELVAEIDRRFAALQRTRVDPPLRTLYATPTGYTTGPNTLMHDLLLAAGVSNFQSRAGWHPLPLERLVYEQPDQLVVAFFDSHDNQQNLWSSARHPVFRELLENNPVVELPGAWTACGGWFLLDAIEALAR